MPDQSRVPTDRTRINMSEPMEVRYWTKELGVGADTLLRAIQKVGNFTKDVRNHLEGRSQKA